MSKKTYYAAENYYGSPSSDGFSNTWYVMAFGSKVARDEWVYGRDTLSARVIKRAEVMKYAPGWDQQKNEYVRPRPFTEECWAIVTEPLEDYPDGCLGVVDVYSPHGYSKLVKRFYS